MTTESKIREEAKSRLTKNWVSALVITIMNSLILLFFIFVVQLFVSIFNIDIQNLKNCSVISNFLFLLISTTCFIGLLAIFIPFNLGVKKWFLEVSEGNDPSILDVFYYFTSWKLYFDSIALFFGIFFRLFIWLYISIFFCLIVLGVSSVFMQISEDIVVKNFSILGIIMSFVIMIFAVIFILILYIKYFLASYIKIRYDDIPPSECIRKSIIYTKSKRKSILKLYLSFIFWMLICFFVIPILYVFPYMNTSLATCAKWILNEREHKISE